MRLLKVNVSIRAESERVTDERGWKPDRHSGSEASKCLCEHSGARDGCVLLIRWVEVAASGYPCVRTEFITPTLVLKLWVLEMGGKPREHGLAS